MAVTLTASNTSNTVGKWAPYYFKPLYIGKLNTAAADGEIYVTQKTGDSAVGISAFCNSSANCNFYYGLTFLYIATGLQYFYVTKYDLNNNEVDTIHASELSVAADGKWWKAYANNTITIDVGVNVHFPNIGSYPFDTNDEYLIKLPSEDTMDRRRIYHGGYSAFLRMPETEGKAYHSDIIPTSLKGKNITILLNPKTGMSTSGNDGLYLAYSKEDLTGNASLSLSLEWNVNKDGATSSTAGSTTYQWGSGETWQLGSLFFNDVDPSDSNDSPAFANYSDSDLDPAVARTGESQLINVTTSGRAGMARIRTEFATGTGSSRVTAFNQFWQIILIIS